LFPFDCVHIPAGVAHSVGNAAPDAELLAHSAFASSRPARKFLQNGYPRENREYADPLPDDPETITRFDRSGVYELAAGAFFRDLFARRFGAVGICGGYGRFAPGSSLPCHIHEYDESITIVSGEATCLVQGREYQLSGYDTAFVPRHQPHRFVNRTGKPMAMIWVYAGDEPDRALVNSDYCSGAQIWPGP
jgi:quercetin dioxygenase-like cupin family protein